MVATKGISLLPYLLMKRLLSDCASYFPKVSY